MKKGAMSMEFIIAMAILGAILVIIMIMLGIQTGTFQKMFNPTCESKGYMCVTSDDDCQLQGRGYFMRPMSCDPKGFEKMLKEDDKVYKKYFDVYQGHPAFEDSQLNKDREKNAEILASRLCPKREKICDCCAKVV